MTTAIVGTGGLGSAVTRRPASGGEALQLSSADKESCRKGNHLAKPSPDGCTVPDRRA